MPAAISREREASDFVVVQNIFTMSSGIMILSNIPSDMVNICCRFKNLFLKTAELRKL